MQIKVKQKTFALSKCSNNGNYHDIPVRNAISIQNFLQNINFQLECVIICWLNDLNCLSLWNRFCARHCCFEIQFQLTKNVKSSGFTCALCDICCANESNMKFDFTSFLFYQQCTCIDYQATTCTESWTRISVYCIDVFAHVLYFVVLANVQFSATSSPNSGKLLVCDMNKRFPAQNTIAVDIKYNDNN